MARDNVASRGHDTAEQKEVRPMPRVTAIILLLLTALTTASCIVEPGPGPDHDRWCYWHPYRCH
jgi:hypothetical protein